LSTVSECEFNRSLGVCLKLYMRKYFEERQATRLAVLDVTREMEEEDEIQKFVAEEEEFEKGVGHDNRWDDEEEDTEEEEGVIAQVRAQFHCRTVCLEKDDTAPLHESQTRNT
jgi:hypothetical protein